MTLSAPYPCFRDSQAARDSDDDETEDEDEGTLNFNYNKGSQPNWSKVLRDYRSLFDESFLAEVEQQESRAVFAKSSDLGVVVTLDTTKSWLADPPHVSQGDTIGTWPDTTNFPHSGKIQSLLPPVEGSRQKLEQMVPFIYKEKRLKEFNSTNIAHRNKIKLPGKVFDSQELSIPKGYHFHTIDNMAKKVLLHNLVSDTLIGAILELLKSTINNLTSLQPETLQRHLEACHDILYMAYSASLRDRQHILALYAANKMKFREVVLDLHVGSSMSKDTLKGTSLFTPHLFGDLPESFLGAVTQAYTANRSNDILLRRKSGVSGSRYSRGASDYSNSSPSKRGKYSSRPLAMSYPSQRQNIDSQEPLFYSARPTPPRTDSPSRRGKKGRSQRYRGSRK